jgi:hypothetical protein
MPKMMQAIIFFTIFTGENIFLKDYVSVIIVYMQESIDKRLSMLNASIFIIGYSLGSALATIGGLNIHFFFVQKLPIV